MGIGLGKTREWGLEEQRRDMGPRRNRVQHEANETSPKDPILL